jgi:hypothetical protein
MRLGIGGGGRIARGGVSVGRGGVRGGAGIGPFSVSGGAGGSGSAGVDFIFGLIVVLLVLTLLVFGLLFFLTGSVIAMSYMVMKGGNQSDLSEKQVWLWEHRLGIIRGSSVVVILSVMLIWGFIDAKIKLNSCVTEPQCRGAELDLRDARDLLGLAIPSGLLHAAALATLRYSKVKSQEVWQFNALKWTQTYTVLYHYCTSIPEKLRRWAG